MFRTPPQKCTCRLGEEIQMYKSTIYASKGGSGGVSVIFTPPPYRIILKYLRRVLTAVDENWELVVLNMRKLRKQWE